MSSLAARKKAQQRARASSVRDTSDDSTAAVKRSRDQKQQELQQAKQWLQTLTPMDILNADNFTPAAISTTQSTFTQHTPFPLARIQKLLDDSVARRLKDELLQLEYFGKSNDLYDFVQSQDLKALSDDKFPLICKVRQCLYSTEMREMLEQVTGITLSPLAEDVSISAAIYDDTHRLLCHDDDIRSSGSARRVAYILYLTDPDAEWKAEWGGHLDCFDTDGSGLPLQIVKSYSPQWNTLLFFAVTPTSYHQVREVVTRSQTDGKQSSPQQPDVSKLRLSISGWYHGDALDLTNHHSSTLPTDDSQCEPLLTDIDTNTLNIDNLVSREYRKTKIQQQICEQFEEDSSIQLANFLRGDVYTQLMQELTNSYQPVQTAEMHTEVESKHADTESKSAESSVPSIQWQHKGPANWRNFEEATFASKSPISIVQQVQTVLRSKMFAELLQQLTGLELESGRCSVRRFAPSGSYTLAHDNDSERELEALDVQLCCIPSNTKWNSSQCGGSVHYIAAGEEEQLLEVKPQPNTLSIVYRTGVAASTTTDTAAASDEPAGTLRFVRYLTHHCPAPRYDLDAVYRPVPGIEDADDDGLSEMDEELEED